jgi:hypothetical protein
MHPLSAALLACILQGVSLRAPVKEQSNTYKITETISTSKIGAVVMTGTETRRIGPPQDGKRSVDIAFKVRISDRRFAGKKAEKWAQAELTSLTEPDHGTLNDFGQLLLIDGPSADAYPIFPNKPVSVGETWKASGFDYKLASVKDNKAQIESNSDVTYRQGSVKRSATWTIEITSGRLISWHLNSAVSYANGTRETVDSKGELESSS